MSWLQVVHLVRSPAGTSCLPTSRPVPIVPQEVRRQRKAEAQEARAAEKAAREQTRHSEELRSYSSLMQVSL